MSKQIHHKVFYEHEPQIVWDYLTKSDLMAEWLMKNDFKPVVGHKFKFLSRPIPDYNFNGIIYCKVLEVVPMKKLSYSWKGGSDTETTMDSIVTFTLHEKNNGTELELLHTGLKEEETGINKLMDQGWLMNMQKIGGLINKA